MSQIKLQLEDPNINGFVIVGYGDGYMSTSNNELLELLKSAYERKKLMILISQSFPEEPIRKEMGTIFQDCGIISGYDMSLPTAVTKMTVIFSQKKSYEENRHLMILNIAGEIS